MLVVFIVSMVVAIASAPKPTVPSPAAFEDFDFPQTDEGTPRIVIFGDCWIEGWMVLGVGNYRYTEIKK
jgi:hypothetical protein